MITRGPSLQQWIGVELDAVSLKEKAVSALGGALGLLCVLGVSKHTLGLAGTPMLIASMGASAVLLFAVPHGQLSQPWPVLAGHAGAALIGVSCAKAIGNIDVAAAVAVGLSIGLMHQLKCIHPPGGATALSAVIGGPAVRTLGYGFVLRPVLLNAVVIVVAAVAFNALFPWRRYPAALNRRRSTSARPPSGSPPPSQAAASQAALSHEAIVAAMRSMDSFIDVTEDDVARLVRLLTEQPQR